MPTRLKRFYIFLCCGLIMGYCIFLYNVVRADTSWSEDFTAFYSGWTVSRSDDRADLYDLETQRRYQADIVARDGHDATDLQDGLLPYLNPPHLSLLAPLSLLSRRNALLVWIVVQMGFLLLLWRSTKDHFAFMVLLATPLVVMAVGVGVLSIVVAVAIWQSYRALRQENHTQAALWMALATIKPQMCLLPLIGFAVIRWRFVWRFILVMAVAAVTTVLVFGVKPWLDYLPFLRMISAMPGRYSLLIASTATFRGLLFTIVGYEYATAVNFAGWAGLAAAIAVTIYVWRSAFSAELKISTAVLLGLFFGPHVNPSDDVLLVIPALLLYRHNKALAWFLCAFPLLMLVEWKTKGFRPFSVSLYLLFGMLSGTMFYRFANTRSEETSLQSSDRPTIEEPSIGPRQKLQSSFSWRRPSQ